tara:strand:+ start:150 stop:515 length:366 start_codon:yes stop_codon:yes gene_type:complete
MDADTMLVDYGSAMCSLELAKKYGLDVEVFCTAITYIRDDPKLSIPEAFKAAQYDWDVCVPLAEEEKESPEEIEEFNNHMRALAKAKELGELASNPEDTKEMKWPESVVKMRWPEDFDSKH